MCSQGSLGTHCKSSPPSQGRLKYFCVDVDDSPEEDLLSDLDEPASDSEGFGTHYLDGRRRRIS